MERLKVNLGEKSYEIIFEQDFAQLVACLGEISAPNKLLIVTDSNVSKLYANEIFAILSASGYDVKQFVFSAGEKNKTMDTILDICRACVAHGMDRQSMIIALGGGVVGDMAGFAASIYMRGIPFVQLPTTLLSQSDSSVGGKTGIDFDGGKNLLGSFHQPKLVYINISTLSTLPKKELISGMGEVIKHGVIRDRTFFYYLSENSERIITLEPATLLRMVKTNCEIKAGVVMQDEYENGLRAILNFGHTIGHAVESTLNFEMTHGACVGIGMIAAAFISLQRKTASPEVLADITIALKKYGFDTKVPIHNRNRVLEQMQKDKKKSDGRLKFILPSQIGKVFQTDDVSDLEILSALEYIDKGE